MRVLPIKLNSELKRTITRDGLIALSGGINAFEEWSKNYSPDEDLFVHGEKKYVKTFYNFMIQKRENGNGPFESYKNSSEIDSLIREIDLK